MSNAAPAKPSAKPADTPLSRWLLSEQGRYIMDWEQQKLSRIVSDIFGFNALQIGLPEIDFLAGNRIPLKLRVGDILQLEQPLKSGSTVSLNGIDLLCELPELPFAANSIDLVVLTHALEFHPHPHHLLREVERVLMPEGKLIIVGFNPFSLWGLHRRLPKCQAGAPWNGRFISLPRIKDWLALLNLDIDRGHFGCYAPPFRSRDWLARCAWMEKAGDRWWPIAAGVYVVRAIKRVHGMRLIKPRWKNAAAQRKFFTTAVRKLRPHD